MPAPKDITGQRFAKLLVLRYSERRSPSNKRMVWCKCDCGTEKELIASNLTSGMAKSCGCLIGESAKERFTKHGYRSHPMYHRWAGMLKRCYDPKNAEYKNYGARGIKVCDRWRDSFWDYVADMGLPPSKDASVDRIDNEKDYSPENCRWATKKEQTINRRRTKMITFNGETLCIADWERKLGYSQGSLKGRIARGMTPEQAVAVPKSRRGIRLRKKNGFSFQEGNGL